MARYYNKTSGLITVTLKDGSATVVPSKQWLPVAPEQDGSSDLQRKVAKGFLVRREDPQSAPVLNISPATPAPALVPDSGPEEVEDLPSMDWRKGDLVAYAEGTGLSVSGMTKAEILEALEGAS